MTTIANARGTKAVRITTDAEGTVRAMYIQYIETLATFGRTIDEQVLQAKTFANIKNAKRWAAKVLA